jgi:hypothetical protein
LYYEKTEFEDQVGIKGFGVVYIMDRDRSWGKMILVKMIPVNYSCKWIMK